MEQLQALKELAEKVEAGNSSNGAKAHEALKLGRDTLKNYFDAHNGSLDAAHSLHKAVLGDRWTAKVKTCGLVFVETTNHEGISGANIDGLPARAWLLAIIKAKISELE